MDTVTLGKTGITVNKNGFGALPIQRISLEDAVALARRAYDGGITFFDTARFYTDSEEKLGAAFDGMREKVYIATKTAAQTPEELSAQLEISLRNLKTDYIDIYQFHNPSFCPKPGDGTGQSGRERFAISASPTIGWLWRKKRLLPVFMRRYSFRFVTSPPKRISRWWRCAGMPEWDLSP